MPIVEYRGKKITLPDDMSEADINNAMPSIADQIDSDFLEVEKPKESSAGFVDKAKGFAKDLALKPFRDALTIAQMTDNRSVTEGYDGAESKETGFDKTAGSRVLREVATKPQNTLNKGAKIVDGAAGIAEVGLRKGYAGLGRIEAGALQLAGDTFGSDTLKNTAQDQLKYANELENAAVLRGTKSKTFEPDALMQDAPRVATNAIGSVITSAPAIVGAALTGGSAIPAIFGTSALSDYGASGDDLNTAGKVAHAVGMGAAEAIGEKIGGTDKVAKALEEALGGKQNLIKLGVSLLTSGAKEIPSEEVTTTAQFLLDKNKYFGLNQNATLDDYIEQVIETAKTAAMQGAGMAGAGGVIKAALNGGPGNKEPEAINNQGIERILAAKLMEDQQKSAESQAALENITLPETSVDEAIELAKIAIDAPIAKPTGLLASLPINDQAINAADILGDEHVVSANDGLASVVETAAEGASDNLQGSLGDILNKSAGGVNSGPVYNPAETLTQSSGSGLDDGIGSQPDNALSELSSPNAEMPSNRVSTNSEPSPNFTKAKSLLNKLVSDGQIPLESISVSDFKRNTSTLESAVNGRFAEANNISDLVSSFTIKQKGFDKLNIPTQASVLSNVIGMAENDKIGDGVVGPSLIFMMDNLRGKQFSSEELLHNNAVLSHTLSTLGDPAIPVVKIGGSVKNTSTINTAEKIGSTLGMGGADGVMLPARGASDVDNISSVKSLLADGGAKESLAFNSIKPTSGDKKINGTGGTIDIRHDVTPNSNVVLGGDEATTSFTPTILPSKPVDLNKATSSENVKTAEAAPILASVSPVESNGLIEVAKIGGKNSKESISVKQSGDRLAVLHNGEPLIDFDTEQDVTVPLNATIDDIKKAVKASGQFNKQILSFNKEYAGVNPTTANTVDIVKPIEAPISKRTQINEKFEQNKEVLRAWMPDMDWATIGGRIIRDDDNQVSGRTTWETKDYDLDAIRKGSGLSFPSMQKAVQKALDGKPLSKVENAAIDAMIELAETIKNSNQTEAELDDNPFLTIEEEDALAQLESDMNWMALLEQSASDDNILASISSQAQNYQDAFNNDIGEYLEQIAEYERQEQRNVSETNTREPQESAGRNERARENESNTDTESQKQSETSGESAAKKLDLLGDDTAGKQAIATEYKPIKYAEAESFVDDSISNVYGEDHLETYKAQNVENVEKVVDLVKYALPASKANGYNLTYEPSSGGSQYLKFEKADDNFEVRIADHAAGYKFDVEKDLEYDDTLEQKYWVDTVLIPHLKNRNAANVSADGVNVKANFNSVANSDKSDAKTSGEVSNLTQQKNNASDLLGQDTSKQQAIADAERTKDAKRNSGTDNQDAFTLTGSNSEADIAAAAGAQDLFRDGTKKVDKPAGVTTASWVIRNKDTGEVIQETFQKSVADKINTDKYEAVPAMQHLQEMNDPDSKVRKYAERDNQTQDEVAKATKALDAAGVTGTEKLNTIAQVRQGNLTADEVASAHKNKIDDFGEKIGGAKKDTYTRKLEQSKEVNVESEPLAKSWPEPNYQELLDNGADSFVVGFLRAVREEIPRKPTKSYRVAGWVKNVTKLRDTAYGLLDGSIDAEKAKSVLAYAASNSHNMDGVQSRIELYQRVGHSKSLKGVKVSFGEYSIRDGIEYKPSLKLWTVEKQQDSTAFSSWPKELSTGKTKQEAIDNFVAKYDSLDIQDAPKSKDVSFDIYSYPKNTGKTGFFIGKKVGRNHIDLENFATVKEAREYKRDHHAELVVKLEKFKEIPNVRRDTNNPRVGEDMRNGQDVTPELFANTFGFKGVEFGNWVEGSKRQKDLNESFDALMDMAAILGIPPKSISLNGELSLAFGARGSGGIDPAKAHYEADYVVINMTKKDGAGSLGHEWWHSLDNYFSRLRNKKSEFMTAPVLDVSLASRGSNYHHSGAVRKEMIDAFGEVVKAINISSLKARSNKLDAKRSKEYWSTGLEMSARAFETYLIAKLQDNNASNDYLANIVDEETWKVAESLGWELDGSYPYPTAAEIPAVRAAFDNFFNVIETKETDKGTALFSRSKSQTDTPEFKKWFGDSKVIDVNGKPMVMHHGTFATSNFDSFYRFSHFGTKQQAQKLLDDTEENYEPYEDSDPDEPPSRILPVFLSIKNPVRISDDGSQHSTYSIAEDLLSQNIITQKEFDYLTVGFDANLEDNLAELIQSKGFDGLVYNNKFEGDGDSFVILNPSQIKSAIGNNGNFDESNPDIRFSKADTSGGMPKADVEKSVNALRANWKNAPQIIVVDDMNDTAIREAVRAENDRQLSQGATGQPEGFFDAGKVYIVASEMNSTDDVARVVMHETLGHYGLRGVFGKDLAKVLESITIMRRKELNAKAKQYGLDTSKASDRLIAAEEVLAEMAQTNPQLGFVQRAIAAIRTWLRDNGFKMKLTDNDIVANYLMPARAYVQRGGKEQSTGDMVAAFNRTNRTPSKESGDTHLTAFMEAIAQNKDLFEYQTINSKNINDIAKAIDIGYEVKPLGASQTKIKNATKAWEVSVPNATHRSGVIYEKGNDVWIDVSRLISGNDRGSAIYAIAADYAHNNGKVLIGDPEGLSRKALYRRNENMLSSALKHGTTKHLMPHIAQEVPSEYYQGHEAEFGKSVRALDWIEGNDVHNIKEMLYNSYDSAIKNIPEVKDVIYNTESGKFEYTDGRPFTTQDSERVSTRIANEPNNPYRAGSGTIKRSALINTFLRKESAGRRAELLGEAVNQLSRNGLSPELKGVMYSRYNPNQSSLTPQWDSPEASKIDSLIYTLQDKHIDLKRVTQAIKKAGNDISDRWNAYLQEELYHGRTAKRTQDFIKDDLEPLIEDMRMRGVSMADFEEYLWMRHAEERNVQIAKVNADMPDGGSGVSTAEAQDYLENLPASNKSKYESLAKRIDLINRKSRQVLIDYGIESADTIAAWEGAYKNYVPLMREDMDAGFGNGTGQGFSVKGNSSKRATGSKRAVVDIIANIAQQYEKNITRGEKNRVATALIGLAKLNPNEDVWQVDTPPTITDVNKATGLVETRTDPNYKSRNNVVVARIRNRLGKIEERSVVFNQFDERAMRMAESIKNLDMDQLNAGLIFMGSITRYFSSINTQYNPIFGVVNITRDVQGAMLNLTTTEIAGKQKEVLKNVMPAMRGIYRDLRSIRKGNQPANTEWAQLWEEYQNEGGATGFKDMYANAGERTEALAKALDPEWWTKTLAGKVVSINGILTVPETALKDKAIKPVFDWLSDYNQTLENAVRLAAYKVALDNGISKQQAASLGKNLTVNFNRKGSMGRTAGSLYAFFNAAVQGTARIGETLTGPKGKQIMVGGIAYGIMQAVLLDALGFDEEEPPEFERATNFIIPTGDKSYVTIPMPLGFNVFPNLGRISAEWAINGMENTTERVFDLFGALMDSFNPLGGNGRIDSIIMPTAFDPFNDLSKNKDHTGRSIAQEDFSSLDPTPGYTRTRDKATAISIELARWINNLSGGDDYEQGQLSPTGDQIEYLIGQVTGGVGRELVKTAATIETIVTGEDLPTYKIPLVGRFIGNSKGQAPQAGKFYNNLTRINKLENGLIGRDRDGKDVDTFINENPEVNYIDYGKKAYSAIRKLRQYKRELVEQDADRNEVKLVDDEITMIMTEFNDTVANAKVEQSP
jgi:hypothetical protein